MKSKRNYAIEYARRIARAVAKGLSKSQARGHPKAGGGRHQAQGVPPSRSKTIACNSRSRCCGRKRA